MMASLSTRIHGCAWKVLTRASGTTQQPISCPTAMRNARCAFLKCGNNMKLHTSSTRHYSILKLANGGSRLQNLSFLNNTIHCLLGRTLCQPSRSFCCGVPETRSSLQPRHPVPIHALITRGLHQNPADDTGQERRNDELEEIVWKLQRQQEYGQEQAALLIKLANENGYLSWCRNAYIAALAGYTILLPYGNDAGLTFFVLGLLNIVTGSVVFIRSDMRHRKAQMRTGVSVLSVAMVVLHVLMYVFVITSVIQFTDDKDDKDGDGDKEVFIEFRDRKNPHRRDRDRDHDRDELD